MNRIFPDQLLDCFSESYLQHAENILENIAYEQKINLVELKKFLKPKNYYKQKLLVFKKTKTKKYKIKPKDKTKIILYDGNKYKWNLDNSYIFDNNGKKCGYINNLKQLIIYF